MLKTILQKMAACDVYNQADLARQLGISEDLLSRMLEDLARKGYLTSLASGGASQGSCSGCSLRKSCAGCSSGRPSLLSGWTLTDKGRAAAAQHRPQEIQ